MTQVLEFLKQCDFFVLATINGTTPAARPFGAVMEVGGELYISTSNLKEVYCQLKDNSAIQIVAVKPNSREWIRINGKAVEVLDVQTKQTMMDTCPVLKNHFKSCIDPSFALFRVTEMVWKFS